MAARLTALPGVSEALAVSLIVIPIFGMQYFLGLSLGFILGAVSPAVVVVGMFDLQKRGYGVSKGIPSLVVAAASFDDVLAITGFSLAIGLAVPQVWRTAPPYFRLSLIVLYFAAPPTPPHCNTVEYGGQGCLAQNEAPSWQGLCSHIDSLPVSGPRESNQTDSSPLQGPRRQG